MFLNAASTLATDGMVASSRAAVMRMAKTTTRDAQAGRETDHHKTSHCGTDHCPPNCDGHAQCRHDRISHAGRIGTGGCKARLAPVGQAMNPIRQGKHKWNDVVARRLSRHGQAAPQVATAMSVTDTHLTRQYSSTTCTARHCKPSASRACFTTIA
jgi:hypothetical protein